MSEDFTNVYNDARRAEAYARLEFPGTYQLAFRDLPALIAAQVRGRRALDFGCGTGRSTRFLRGLGFAAVGIDIAEPMLALARAADADGDYRLVTTAGLADFPAAAYDLLLSAFTFDNIPGWDEKMSLLRGLGRLLAPGGRIISIVSSPDIYLNEWASFSTRDFPENRAAKSGERVRIVMLDVPDQRPVEDIVWFDADYLAVYRESGLAVHEVLRPLARGDEPWPWVSETRIAPWVIYALGRADEASPAARGG